jgi:tRNA1Val (adenine37-N6)-methyltransferase
LKHEPGETTHDTLFGGSLSLRQPARSRGYRVNVDALLLASFVRSAHHAIDLGSGVGGVGLSLMHLGKARRLTMVEIDPALAALARVNAAENGWEAEVIEGDVGSVAVTGDLIVCNPPYVPPGRGRAPSPAVARAKQGSLSRFVGAARRTAGRRARIAFVYPAIEATTLLASLRAAGIEPKRLRVVHARASSPARVVLVEGAVAKPGGLVIEPPFIEMEGRARTEELTALLAHPRVAR